MLSTFVTMKQVQIYKEAAMKEYIVYVKIDVNGYITDVNSSAFLTATDGWMEIDSGHGDKYHHAQGNYFSKPIEANDGIWRYKLVNDVAVECSAEEIAEQKEALLKPEQTQDPILSVYDELEAAYQEGVNSI